MNCKLFSGIDKYATMKESEYMKLPVVILSFVSALTALAAAIIGIIAKAKNKM